VIPVIIETEKFQKGKKVGLIEVYFWTLGRK